MMLRSCKVAIVAVIGPLTVLHLDFFFKLVEAAAHARATSIFPSLCHHFLALEFEPDTKLIEWEPDSWVPVFSKMKM